MPRWLESTNSVIRHYFKTLEVLGFVVTGIAIIYSYIGYLGVQDREIFVRNRSIDEQQFERNHDFYVSQLRIYAEASEIFIRLRTNPIDSAEYRTTERRFWEIYFGDLPFFGSPEAIEAAHEFCLVAFREDQARCRADQNMNLQTAARFAERASKEIKERSEKGKLAGEH